LSLATSTRVEPDAQPVEGIDLKSGRFPTIPARETKIGSSLAFLAWTLAVYDFILFGTLLPRISETFGWSEAQTLLVNTLVSVGVFIVVVVVGTFVDRLGRRRGMMMTVGGAAASSLLTAASTGAASLVGFRALSGFGMAEQSINSTYLNEVYALTESPTIRKRRGFIYSMVQTGWPFGALLAAAFIAVINATFGEGAWRWAFAIATLPALLVLVLRRGIHETPQHKLNQYLKRLVAEGRGAEAQEIADRSASPSPPPTRRARSSPANSGATPSSCPWAGSPTTSASPPSRSSAPPCWRTSKASRPRLPC
jgi:MFS family permease